MAEENNRIWRTIWIGIFAIIALMFVIAFLIRHNVGLVEGAIQTDRTEVFKQLAVQMAKECDTFEQAEKNVQIVVNVMTSCRQEKTILCKDLKFFLMVFKSASNDEEKADALENFKKWGKNNET